jgi:hypothetical protein
LDPFVETVDEESNEKSRRVRNRRRVRSGGLFPGAVGALARIILCGLNLNAVLFAGGRDEPTHAVRLPVGGFWISAGVAPLARAIMSRIFAPLLSARGAAAFLLAFAPASAAFSGAGPLALAPCLAPLAAFSGATCATCAATAAALSVVLVSAVVMCVGILFCACFAHDDSSLWSRENASGKR